MKLYVVRNKENKYFRSIGYGGANTTNWVDTLEKAKFYAKIGQAKSRVTFFYKNWPDYGCCEILEFEIRVENAKILDMSAETNKKIEKSKKKELEYQKWNREQEILRLQNEQKRIDERLKSFGDLA